jgi:cytochrome c oxidase assembly protein subunit 15
MSAKTYRLLALLTCAGMFLVLIAGVLVTNTKSGRGCGTDWPLCNGKFIPAYTLESMVEYSHRAISGIVGLLTAAAFAATLLRRPRSAEAVLYASGALLFTVLQAVLGAAAVLWPTSSAVLALHFGISMFAFTCTWLLYSASKQAQPAASGPQRGAARALRAAPPAGRRPLPGGVFGAIAVLVVYCYGVVYLGAYVRHTSSAGGCAGWPLCNGRLVPELTGAAAIVFAHRAAAAVLLLATLLLLVYVRRRAGAHCELTGLAAAAAALALAQVLSGALLTYTMGDADVYVFTSLLHTIIISAYFSLLCLMAVRAWRLSRR